MLNVALGPCYSKVTNKTENSTCSKKVTVDNETQSPYIDFDQTLVKKEKNRIWLFYNITATLQKSPHVVW